MSALSLRLPNSLHQRARELAEREGISINQLVSTALAEKMSALMTEEYLETRARRGSRTGLLRALRQVPDVEPDPEDRLPTLPPRKQPSAPSKWSSKVEIATQRRLTNAALDKGAEECALRAESYGCSLHECALRYDATGSTYVHHRGNAVVGGTPQEEGRGRACLPHVFFQE